MILLEILRDELIIKIDNNLKKYLVYNEKYILLTFQLLNTL